MKKNTVKRLLKIWLWLCLISCSFTFIGGLISFAVLPGYARVQTSYLFFAVMQIIVISLILFKKNVLGVYMQAGVLIGQTAYFAFESSTSFAMLLLQALSAIVNFTILYVLAIKKNGISLLSGADSDGDHPVQSSWSDQNQNDNEGFVTEPVQTAPVFAMAGGAAAVSFEDMEEVFPDNSTNVSTPPPFNPVFMQDSQTAASAMAEAQYQKTHDKEMPISTEAKRINITEDLYNELEIDRELDEHGIRNHLKKLQKIWIQRQGATDDKEQLLLIDQVLEYVEKAYRYLTKPLRRKAYDEALYFAYKTGILKDKVEEQFQNYLEQAKAYYRQGKVKLAAQMAQEAVDGKINDPEAYDLLARCYYETDDYVKAIQSINSGIAIFKDNIDLHWLGCRIATLGTRDFADAQERVNKLLALAPNSSIGYREQVNLHLRSGKEDLAYQEMDDYISKHGDDELFKQNVAYDLISYSYTYYYTDNATENMFIADKQAYKNCLNLCSKAAEIYSDEHTQRNLERAKYYGKREWDSWNSRSMLHLFLYGIIFAFLGSAHPVFGTIAAFLFIVDAMVLYYSFRPYWQINKTIVTGEMGAVESLITTVAEYSVVGARKLLIFLVKAVTALIKGIIYFLFHLMRM